MQTIVPNIEVPDTLASAVKPEAEPKDEDPKEARAHLNTETKQPQPEAFNIVKAANSNGTMPDAEVELEKQPSQLEVIPEVPQESVRHNEMETKDQEIL